MTPVVSLFSGTYDADRRRDPSPIHIRKQIVEAVFGQIKQARGFRQFLLRGLENVAAEWAMICTAHNLVKLGNFKSAA